NQPALAITPRSKVLDVDIANAQHASRARKFRADLRPQLHPPVEGGAQEGERAFSHPLMFQLQIDIEQGHSLPEPMFVRACRLPDIHVPANVSPWVAAASLKRGLACQQTRCW